MQLIFVCFYLASFYLLYISEVYFKGEIYLKTYNLKRLTNYFTNVMTNNLRK